MLTKIRYETGSGRAVSISDTGALSEPFLLQAKRGLGDYGANAEFHVRLLAPRPAARSAALADLAGQFG